MNKRGFLQAAALALSLLLVAGCGGAAGAAKATTIKVAVLVPKGDAGFEFMAQSRGDFKAHGVNVKYVPINNSLTILQALLGGSVDMIEVSPGAALAADAKSHGKPPLVIVGATMPSLPDALYVRGNIHSLAQVCGHTFSTNPGALSQLLMRLILKAKGLNPNCVHWVGGGGSSSQEFKAVLTGKVDAAIGSIQFGTQLKPGSPVRELLQIPDVLPQFVRYVLIARRTFIQAHPKALVGFLEGEAQGLRYALTHRQAEIALAAKKTKTSTKNPALSLIYDTYVSKHMIAPNLNLDPARITYMQKLNLGIGTQKKLLPTSEVLDMSFQKKAIAAIGTYKGK